ncbi:hypothetical protein GBA52_005996 [Prunus armeniaca]|nr:hypothetical protein GBA52_005996 [Prunus armeniaca]
MGPLLCNLPNLQLSPISMHTWQTPGAVSTAYHGTRGTGATSWIPPEEDATQFHLPTAMVNGVMALWDGENV